MASRDRHTQPVKVIPRRYLARATTLCIRWFHVKSWPSSLHVEGRSCDSVQGLISTRREAKAVLEVGHRSKGGTMGRGYPPKTDHVFFMEKSCVNHIAYLNGIEIPLSHLSNRRGMFVYPPRLPGVQAPDTSFRGSFRHVAPYLPQPRKDKACARARR